jgi:muramoyltetrapeptide carboxypeptidase LdcA involved in peptidoglycan recycling
LALLAKSTKNHLRLLQLACFSLTYYQGLKEMQPLIKPPKLNYKDTVAAITLSWGGPATFPYRFEVGKQRLEEIFGLRVIPTKHAFKSAEWIYENPKARADDLMEAFLDPNIKGIISNIGGDDSLRLIPFIDFNIIKNNPKVVMGYSDTTVTHFIMKTLKHTTAKASYYNTRAECYDEFNENNSSMQSMRF